MGRADYDPGMDGPSSPTISPDNRLGLDYRAAPGRKWCGPITDIHAHVRGVELSRAYFEACDAYGIARTVTMSPLAEVDALRAAYPGRLEFIAIPRWREFAATAEFQRQWMADLAEFRGKGARLCKFWMAPEMRKKHGLTLDSPFIREVAEHARRLDFDFMVHAGDPSVWWPGKYGGAGYGTKDEQYPPLERFLDDYGDRLVIGAHMGGSVEELERLQGLLDRHPNFVVDSSATKWMAREVARQPAAVRAFVVRNQHRVLFGSDQVVKEGGSFDHYASRYWVHQMMWESDYRGESPIDDPDTSPPMLAGLDLPAEVLGRMYWGNASRLIFGE